MTMEMCELLTLRNVFDSVQWGIFSLVPRRSRLGSTVSCDVTVRERTPKQCGGLLLVLLIPYR